MHRIDRAKKIIISPNSEWNTITNEVPETRKIISSYVLPLAGAAAVAAFIGYGFIGVSYLDVRIAGFNWGLYQALTILISAIASVYISANVIDGLAPSFDSEKNIGRSIQLVAYAFTPSWIGGLLAIFPPLAILGYLFSLYGLYLLYIGLPKLKSTPPSKVTSYFVVSIITTVIVYMVVDYVISTLLSSLFGTDISKAVLNEEPV